MVKFAPHKLEWSPEHIQRFWDHYSFDPSRQDHYFSRQVGRSLVRYVRGRIKVGFVADIGCGRGDLIGFLLAAGFRALGTDQSPESVTEVARRFDGHPRFAGAFLGTSGLADASMDTAFLVEVIEHLDEGAFAAAMVEAHRILRPGGHLILTTPNNENLKENEVLCPDCGATFHRVQHVRSWTAKSLQTAAAEFGFAPISVTETTLRAQGLFGLAYVMFNRLRRSAPNLVYIGQRSTG